MLGCSQGTVWSFWSCLGSLTSKGCIVFRRKIQPSGRYATLPITTVRNVRGPWTFSVSAAMVTLHLLDDLWTCACLGVLLYLHSPRMGSIPIPSSCRSTTKKYRSRERESSDRRVISYRTVLGNCLSYVYFFWYAGNMSGVLREEVPTNWNSSEK